MQQRALENIFRDPADRAFLMRKAYSLSKGIEDLNPVTKSSVLHDAVKAEKEKIVKVLLEEKACVDEYSQDTGYAWRGRTPLHLATFIGNKPIVELLLAHKASIDKQDSVGLSPLMLAASRGKKEVVNTLIEAGADINQESSPKESSENGEYFKGKTALMHAAAVNSKDIMRLLMEQKDISLTNSQQKMFFEYCTNPKTREEMQKDAKSITIKEEELKNNLMPTSSLSSLLVPSAVEKTPKSKPQKLNAPQKNRKSAYHPGMYNIDTTMLTSDKLKPPTYADLVKKWPGHK